MPKPLNPGLGRDTVFYILYNQYNETLNHPALKNGVDPPGLPLGPQIKDLPSVLGDFSYILSGLGRETVYSTPGHYDDYGGGGGASTVPVVADHVSDFLLIV